MARQNEQQLPSPTGNLATVKDILASLAAIGLPAPERPALEAISANCREAFLDALRVCVMKKDADGAKRAFIENVLACLDPSVSGTLKSLQISADPADLVRIAEFQPARFRSAVAIAQQRSHQRHTEAVEFLRSLILDKPWQSAQAPQPTDSPQSVYDIPGMPPAPYSVSQQQATPPAPRQRESREPIRQNDTSGQRPAPANSSERQPPADAAPSRTGQAARDEESGSARPFRSHHVYGSDYALCFNASASPDGSPSIMVDAAAANGQRSYDWKNAIHIMLDVREVACVLAVFRKWRPQVVFSAHGKRNDKAFSLAWQGQHIFCKVSAKMDVKPVRAVKIMAHDAIQVAMLFLEQLLLAYPNVPASEVLELARSVNTFNERAAVNQ